MFDIDSLIVRLKAHADEKYRLFNESLIPGAENTSLGVRMPVLRSMAKEILKDDTYGFLNAGLSQPIHEIRLLYGIVLGGLKCSINDKIALTEHFLPHIDNWAVCDTFCSSFKPIPEEKEILFSFLKECAESDEEYRKRFGLVMMMNYYHDDEWIDSVLEVYREFRHEGYYARMAAAWGLATLYVYHPESILEILRDNHYDAFTHNKTIQKMIESYRISDEDKRMLRDLRRKQEKKMIHSTLCYIEREDQYLMLHRTKKENDANHDKWIGIGGRIESGETPEICILREAKEETGLDLLDLRYRGIVHFRSDRWEDEEMHLFTATEFTGEMIACSEGDLEWIDKSHLLELTLWEGDKIFLKLLDTDEPFFDLTLNYCGEALTAAILNGKNLMQEAKN